MFMYLTEKNQYCGGVGEGRRHAAILKMKNVAKDIILVAIGPISNRMGEVILDSMNVHTTG